MDCTAPALPQAPASIKKAKLGWLTKLQKTALVFGLLPFVLSATVWSYSASNGRITSFEFKDYGALAFGSVAVFLALLALIRVGSQAPGKRLLYGLVVLALLGLGAYQVAYGTGAFIDPYEFLASR